MKVMNLVNNYLDRTTSADRKVISASLVNFILVKKKGKRARRSPADEDEDDFLWEAMETHPEESVREVISIGQEFDCDSAKKLMEWGLNGISSHTEIPWRAPAGETEHDKIRRLHRAVILTETEVGSAASRRRLSHLFLASALEVLGPNESFALVRLLEIIYGQDWNNQAGSGEKRKKQLKYKLKAGRRWLQLGKEFGIGIVMFPGLNFPHSFFEQKLRKSGIQLLIDCLRGCRQDVLEMVAEATSIITQHIDITLPQSNEEDGRDITAFAPSSRPRHRNKSYPPESSNDGARSGQTIIGISPSPETPETPAADIHNVSVEGKGKERNALVSSKLRNRRNRRHRKSIKDKEEAPQVIPIAAKQAENSVGLAPRTLYEDLGMHDLPDEELEREGAFKGASSTAGDRVDAFYPAPGADAEVNDPVARMGEDAILDDRNNGASPVPLTAAQDYEMLEDEDTDLPLANFEATPMASKPSLTRTLFGVSRENPTESPVSLGFALPEDEDQSRIGYTGNLGMPEVNSSGYQPEISAPNVVEAPINIAEFRADLLEDGNQGQMGYTVNPEMLMNLSGYQSGISSPNLAQTPMDIAGSRADLLEGGNQGQTGHAINPGVFEVDPLAYQLAGAPMGARFRPMDARFRANPPEGGGRGQTGYAISPGMLGVNSSGYQPKISAPNLVETPDFGVYLLEDETQGQTGDNTNLKVLEFGPPSYQPNSGPQHNSTNATDLSTEAGDEALEGVLSAASKAPSPHLTYFPSSEDLSVPPQTIDPRESVYHGESSPISPSQRTPNIVQDPINSSLEPEPKPDEVTPMLLQIADPRDSVHHGTSNPVPESSPISPSRHTSDVVQDPVNSSLKPGLKSNEVTSMPRQTIDPRDSVHHGTSSPVPESSPISPSRHTPDVVRDSVNSGLKPGLKPNEVTSTPGQIVDPISEVANEEVSPEAFGSNSIDSEIEVADETISPEIPDLSPVSNPIVSNLPALNLVGSSVGLDSKFKLTAGDSIRLSAGEENVQYKEVPREVGDGVSSELLDPSPDENFSAPHVHETIGMVSEIANEGVGSRSESFGVGSVDAPIDSWGLDLDSVDDLNSSFNFTPSEAPPATYQVINPELGMESDRSNSGYPSHTLAGILNNSNPVVTNPTENFMGLDPGFSAVTYENLGGTINLRALETDPSSHQPNSASSDNSNSSLWRSPPESVDGNSAAGGQINISETASGASESAYSSAEEENTLSGENFGGIDDGASSEPLTPDPLGLSSSENPSALDVHQIISSTSEIANKAASPKALSPVLVSFSFDQINPPEQNLLEGSHNLSFESGPPSDDTTPIPSQIASQTSEVENNELKPIDESSLVLVQVAKPTPGTTNDGVSPTALNLDPVELSLSIGLLPGAVHAAAIQGASAWAQGEYYLMMEKTFWVWWEDLSGILKIGTHELLASDVLRLKGNKWINDNIIDCLLDFHKSPDYVLFNSKMLSRIPGSKSLSFIGRSQGPKIMAPFNHNGNHWVLLVINCEEKALTVYDSIKSSRQATNWKYILQRIFDADKYPAVVDEWSVQIAVCGTQTDSSSCGIFTIWHGICLFNGYDPTIPKDPKLLRLDFAKIIKKVAISGRETFEISDGSDHEPKSEEDIL